MNNALRNTYLGFDLIKFKFNRFLLSGGRAEEVSSEHKAIPKIIHYAWFGNGSMSDLCYECMQPGIR